MSRFARITEDPDYEDNFDEFEEANGWSDIDTAPLGAIVDSWIRKSVAEMPQDEYSPYETINS